MRSTTVLGDWYGTLVIARPAHLVLWASAQSLLPVVIAAAPVSGLVRRFQEGVLAMLRALGIAEEAMAREAEAMADVVFAATANRRVLGSLNEFRRMLPSYLERGESLLEASLELAEAPCGPIGMESPRRMTLQIFQGGRA